MYKKTMTYTDYNGTERTEDFYFDLNKAELLELQVETDGGLESIINKIIAEKNQKEMIKIFKMLLLKSYGKKSDDGKRFMKSEEITKEFVENPAYADLFMLLATNEMEAGNFVNGVTPKDLAVDQSKIVDMKAKLSGNVEVLNPV